MRAEALLRPVPPDLCYLHNFDAPEHPRALRLPAGEGRLLRQLMAQLAKHLQTEVPKRLAAPDFKLASEQIARHNPDRGRPCLCRTQRLCRARHFGLMREQGNLVFTLKDARGEPVTSGKAMALTTEQRLKIDSDEGSVAPGDQPVSGKNQCDETRDERAPGRFASPAIKPMLEHELQEIRNALRKKIKDSVKLGNYLDQIQHNVLENLELFEPCEERRASGGAAGGLVALSGQRGGGQPWPGRCPGDPGGGQPAIS